MRRRAGWRRSDVGVECGNPPDDSLEANQPRLIAEVLSRTTIELDLIDKLAEYQTVPSLDAIMLIDPNWPQLRVIRRDHTGRWQSPERYNGVDDVIEIPQWSFMVPLAELYEGLEFRPRPILVDKEPAEPRPPATI